MGWIRAQFKGQKVWVEVDDSGALRSDGGRVAMRYSDRAGAKVYRAGVGNLALEAGAPVDLPEGAPADASTGPSARGQGRGRGFGSAGSRTAGQAVAARVAGRELIEGFDADAIVCFTDGACKGNPGPAGAGAVVRLPDGRHLERYAALGRATNNIGELTAIGLALDLLDEEGVPADATVEILTDSDYSHGVLARGWKAKANQELIEELRRRLARRRHRLHWIAGHVGIEENERADALASLGAEESMR